MARLRYLLFRRWSRLSIGTILLEDLFAIVSVEKLVSLIEILLKI
jgi:hypothetical protein